MLALQLRLSTFERLGKSFGFAELLHGKICIIFKVSLKYFLFFIFVKCFCNDHFWTFAMEGYQYNFPLARLKINISRMWKINKGYSTNGSLCGGNHPCKQWSSKKLKICANIPLLAIKKNLDCLEEFVYRQFLTLVFT